MLKLKFFFFSFCKSFWNGDGASFLSTRVQQINSQHSPPFIAWCKGSWWILFTFYSFEEAHFTRVGWGNEDAEYFLHCVTIWQISQLGSSRRGNLENAQVSPISKGGRTHLSCSQLTQCVEHGWVWCHVGALLLIWWSGWGYYRETLPQSDRVQCTQNRQQKQC